MRKMCSMNMVCRWQEKWIVVVVAMMAILVFVVPEQRSRSLNHRKEKPSLIIALTSHAFLPQQRTKTQTMARQIVSMDTRDNPRQIHQEEEDNSKVNEREKKRLNHDKKKPELKNTQKRKLPPYIRRILPIVNRPIERRVGRGKVQKTRCGRSYRVKKDQNFRIRLSKRKLCNNIFRAAKDTAFYLSCKKIVVGDCSQGEFFLSDGATLTTKYCGDNSGPLKARKLTELFLNYKPTEPSGVNITKPVIKCIIRGKKGKGYSADGNQKCPLSCGQTVANAEADKKSDDLSTTSATPRDVPFTVSGVGIHLTTIPPLITNHANASLHNISNRSTVSKEKNLGRRVQGGKHADKGEWPWIVYIKYKENGSLLICGGTIITSQHILTAAHCFSEVNMTRGDTIKVIAYEYNTADKNETPKQMSFVSKISLHPKYDSKTLNADIAVLHLRKTLTFGPGVAPVCFAPAGNYEGSKVVILGWGTLRKDGLLPDVLQEGTQIVDNTDECAKNYSKFEQPVTHKHVCASYPGRDSCDGDSGGPLLVQIGTSWYQLGIISFGKGCGKPRFPGVNTLVPSYIPWILNKTKKSTCY